MFEFGDVKMTMNPPKRSISKEEQDLVAEYLKNGGSVTKCKEGKTSYELGISNYQWGQKKPKDKDKK